MNDQQRAAMTMALEALEWYGDDWDEGKYKDVKKAQAALREALNTRSSSTHSDAEYSEVAQPQGEWVDLTDDELKAVALPLVPDEPENDSDDMALKIFHAVIAKFKEKNTPPSVEAAIERERLLAYAAKEMAVAGAIEATKERCAKVCEAEARASCDDYEAGGMFECAAAIRSMK